MKGWYGNKQRHMIASKGVRSTDLSKDPSKFKTGEYDPKQMGLTLHEYLEMLKTHPEDIDWDEVDEIYASFGIKKDSVEAFAMDIITRLHVGRFKEAGKIYTDFIDQYGEEMIPELNLEMNKIDKKFDVSDLDRKIMINYYEKDYSSRGMTKFGMKELEYMNFYDMKNILEENGYPTHRNDTEYDLRKALFKHIDSGRLPESVLFASGKRKEMTVPQKHALKVARRTLNYPDAIANVMGGMTKERAEEIVAMYKSGDYSW